MCPFRSVTQSSVEIRRSMTHELVIQGKGFTRVFPPIFVFDPPIARPDYVVHVRLGTCAAVVTREYCCPTAVVMLRYGSVL